jgi:FixJ family two-component response regulator
MAAPQTVVIVVDDDTGFLKGVARLLAYNGIETRTFASAEALIESGSAPTETCLLLDSTSAEFPGSSCSTDLWHLDRSALSSS